jgi:hypothetical protein
MGPKRRLFIAATGRAPIVKDAADARRRALIRLDERGVIVRFNLERRAPPVADVDDTRVLARPLHQQLTFGGQPAKVYLGRLVRAMLRPHHRKDPQLGEVRFAPHQLFDPLVLLGRDVVLIQNFGCDHIPRRE